MIKQEFEGLALRGNAEISQLLYDTVERYYMSDNNYHAAHGGIYETKQQFVKRVFGGKVNTPRTICEKMIKEAQKENRWCLQGCKSATKDRLDDMDEMIAEHIRWEARTRY
jgi:hypothetical protein